MVDSEAAVRRRLRRVVIASSVPLLVILGLFGASLGAVFLLGDGAWPEDRLLAMLVAIPGGFVAMVLANDGALHAFHYADREAAPPRGSSAIFSPRWQARIVGACGVLVAFHWIPFAVVDAPVSWGGTAIVWLIAAFAALGTRHALSLSRTRRERWREDAGKN